MHIYYTIKYLGELKVVANEDTLIVADTLLLMMFLGWANEWDTKHLFCVRAARTRKHLLQTQNVSDKNQKHFLCLGHKFCVRNKCCARGQTGKHLCPQQCVRNIVSSFATTFTTRGFDFQDKRSCQSSKMKYSGDIYYNNCT